MCSTFVTTNEPTLIIIINWSSWFRSVSLVFTCYSCSVSESHPGYCLTCSCHVSLDSSWLWQFFRVSLTLTVVRNWDQRSRRMALFWSLMLFSWWKSGSWVWEDRRGEMSFWAHRIKSAYDQQDFLQLILLPVKLLFPLFLHHPLWKEVTMCNPPPLRSEEFRFRPWWWGIYRIDLQDFCMGDLALLLIY